MNEKLNHYEEKMKKTMANLEGELAAIRAGRANPNVLNKIMVDYYGTPTPIQQVGNVSVPEPRMIQIQPWEKAMVKQIEKAIQTSDLGINPTNDGSVIRLVFPELTEERRKELVKDVKKKGEAAKVAVRNIRRDGNDAFKKLKGSDVSEDEIKDMEDDLQKLTDKFIKEIDKAVEVKSKEVMTVQEKAGDRSQRNFGGCPQFMEGVNFMKIPAHIAIILDGNGRWAKAKGMPRNYGHAQGSKNVERICEEAYRMGVKYLTVYAFSTENWNRPKDEVDALMKLLRNYMKTCLKTAAKNDMKVRVIGDKTGLDEDIRNRIAELEEATKDNGGLNFQSALNYGSRDEIVRAVRRVSEDVKEGKVKPEDIDEKMFETYLDTHGIPDPDLMIRTSGELRLSNYLLWQLAYTEFYFTDIPWPDFTKEELSKAIEQYNRRDRRYGGVKEAQEDV